MKSALYFSTDKGLSNQAGHNNCFLNSAVQVFWHLQVFRRNFLAMKHHGCVEGSCIYCALQEIFREFASSYTEVIDPDMLRVTLAVAFEDQKKFQLGELDDASECYEKILSRVHFHLTNGFSDDFCSHKHCITHQKFAMSLIEQTSCECSATSEPLVFTQLVHYISTSAIINCSKDKTSDEDFSQLLRRAYEREVTPSSCPQGCPLRTKLTRTLLTQPDVVTIGLVWNSDQSDLSHIKEFVSCISDEVYLHKLFYCPEISPSLYPSSRRVLVGVVCYYMKHYSTFFKRSLDGKWISFDDGSVTEIGHDWSKVVNKVCKGRYQPLLLIFQNPEADYLDTSTAPKHNYLIKKNYEEPSKSPREMKDFAPTEIFTSNTNQATSNKPSGSNKYQKTPNNNQKTPDNNQIISSNSLSNSLSNSNNSSNSSISIINYNNSSSVGGVSDVKGTLWSTRPSNHLSINNPLFNHPTLQPSPLNNPFTYLQNVSNIHHPPKNSHQNHEIVNPHQNPPCFNPNFDGGFNDNFPKLTAKPQTMVINEKVKEMEKYERIQQLNIQIRSNDLQRKVLERRAQNNINQPYINNQSSNTSNLESQFQNDINRTNHLNPKTLQNFPMSIHHHSTLPHPSSSFSSSYNNHNNNQHYNTIPNHSLYPHQNNPTSHDFQINNLTKNFTHHFINDEENNDMRDERRVQEYLDKENSTRNDLREINTESGIRNSSYKMNNNNNKTNKPINNTNRNINTYNNNPTEHHNNNFSSKNIRSNNKHYQGNPSNRELSNSIPSNGTHSNRDPENGNHSSRDPSNGNHDSDLMNFEDEHLKDLKKHIGALYKQ